MTSTTLPPRGVVGAQEPRVHSAPPGQAGAGEEATNLAAKAGLYLDPWQQLVLSDAMREQRGGRWAAFEVGLICPRQNGKGSVLEALELSALFLADPDLPPPLILHSAHEFKTSAEHFRRMRDLIESTELFRRQVRIIRTAAGAESIELHSGARLRFVTRSGGSGRGFSADLVVVDEAYNLTAEAMAAMLPTLSARPNPQVWYTSSAGMAASEQLARIRARGVAGDDPTLAFFEWSAGTDADLDDRGAWAQANPALGRRITEEFVARERAALPDEQFARERLGMWADSTKDAGAFSTEQWAALADPNAPRGANPVFGVAVAPDRSWSAVAVAWRRPDGLPQVMLADYRPDATWLRERVAELRARWGGRVLVDQAGRGIVPDASEPSTAEQAQADNALSDAVIAGNLRHGNEAALNVAVRGSRWRSSGDTRLLDRKGSVDVSPLRAASLAVHGLSNGAAPGGWMIGV